jgi:hypothetical protein
MSDQDDRKPDYDVCLSFAGEQRPYVERVATALRGRNIRVFYDSYERANLWGKDLSQHLDHIYGKAATFCVVFVSQQYAEKIWTNHELKSAQARAVARNEEYILPARFDDAELPGLRPTIGYIDLSNTAPSELADLIAEKLLLSRSSQPTSQLREIRPKARRETTGTSNGWWRTMSKSEQVAAAVIGGLFATAAAVIPSVLLSQSPSGQGDGRPSAPASSGSPVSSTTHPPGNSGTSSLTCPSGKATWYKKPTPLPALATTSFVFCPVDVNNGQPMENILYLAGNILGRIPKGEILALVSWPDPSTCAVDGSPGSAIYYYQTQLTPQAGSGYWQWTTTSAGPGNQTIKRYIYFVLAPDTALAQLKNDSISLPSDVHELAYITAQGTIPHGHHC